MRLRLSNWLLITLVLVFIGLQIRLWWGPSSYAEVRQLQQQISALEQQVEQQRQREAQLRSEVDALRSQGDPDAIVEQIRERLGYTREGETLFLFPTE
jgi:cell division protein FtsB